MSAQTSFFANVGGYIKAASTKTSGAPLVLKFHGHDGERAGEATFYTGDQDYTDRLIAAINAVPVNLNTAPVDLLESLKALTELVSADSRYDECVALQTARSEIAKVEAA